MKTFLIQFRRKNELLPFFLNAPSLGLAFGRAKDYSLHLNADIETIAELFPMGELNELPKMLAGC